MASYMTLAYRALKAAGVAGNTGTLEQRVAVGIAALGTFGGADVGALDGNGPPLRQLLRAMTPAPTRRGPIFRALVGGGPRHFLSAVNAAIAAGGGGDPEPDPVPPWLDDLEPEVIEAGGGGFELSEGEAYIDGQHITDLSQVFTNWDPTKQSVDGYDFGNWQANHFLEWELNLLALVASMEFAFRMQFKPAPSDFYDIHLINFETDVGGADAHIDEGTGSTSLWVADGPNGDQGHYMGPVVHNNTYVLAASNNPEGWRATLNGAPTVLDPTQTVGTCERVFVGYNNGVKRMNGHIKKLTFRPNGMDDAALRAWANA